ncbi:MAG: PAS domain S-box protein [Sphingomonas sp.]
MTRHAPDDADFRDMADHAPVMMWVTDPQGHCLYLNRRWYEFTGQTPAQAEGSGWLDATHPDDRAATERAFLDANARRAPFRVECRLRMVDGSYHWAIDAASPRFGPDGEYLGYVGSVIDIQDRREAEEAVRELNERLEVEVAQRTAERDRMWDTSPDLMATMGFDGVLRRVNPAWTRLLGYDADALVGHHVNDFVLPEDHAPTLAACARAAAGDSPRIENRYRHKDGSVRCISWVAAPAGDITYATGRDVTAEKAQAAALHETEEQLRQAQKMESIGQLTGGIAHDFNNLLTGVIGSLDMIQRRIRRGEIDRIERYAAAAMTSANRAAALTHRLLAFSRRQPLDPRPVDANKLVTGTEELLRRTIGAAIRLEIVTAGGLWRTLCDPNQLESAILNLAINARDAMPDGGVLTIETGNAHLDSAYAAQISGVRPGQYVCICVTDTGIGMSAEVMARVFEPFFTTKPIGQGTGLGLSMIYGFARQSEGYAKLYSEPGQGTTVKLYLPRFHGTDDPGDTIDAVLSDAHRAGDGEVVMVVEDETAVRDLVVDVLKELGYRAIEAVDGPSGLKLLNSDVHIDLLVTDVGLPGLNGRQLADAAREHRPELRVLFMTGYAENAAVASGFLDPGMEMITKPFAIEVLATRIREMIEDQAPR